MIISTIPSSFRLARTPETDRLPILTVWLGPDAPTGGPFRPISTTGDVEICEHMPLMAKQMHNMAIIRSMSTREADHTRGRYYMHTGYVPNPNITHPSYGSVLSKQLDRELMIPQFISVNGGSMGAGFWVRSIHHWS